jgi:hypothetical protein
MKRNGLQTAKVAWKEGVVVDFLENVRSSRAYKLIHSNSAGPIFLLFLIKYRQCHTISVTMFKIRVIK